MDYERSEIVRFGQGTFQIMLVMPACMVFVVGIAVWVSYPYLGHCNSWRNRWPVDKFFWLSITNKYQHIRENVMVHEL